MINVFKGRPILGGGFIITVRLSNDIQEEVLLLRRALVKALGQMEGDVKKYLRLSRANSIGILNTTGTSSMKAAHAVSIRSAEAPAVLRRTLDAKVMAKYEEAQAREAVEAARKAGALADLHTCPFCGVQAELPEGNSVFSCPGCERDSCRHCGEPSHLPLRCEEVEEARTHLRHLPLREGVPEPLPQAVPWYSSAVSPRKVRHLPSAFAVVVIAMSLSVLSPLSSP